jgi:hypothetical protein
MTVILFQVSKVPHNGVTSMDKVAADLVEAAGVRSGLDDRELAGKAVKNLKSGFGGFFRRILGFTKRDFALPGRTNGMSVNYGEVGLLNTTFFERLAEFFSRILVESKEDDP